MKNNSEVCSVCQNGGARGETPWHRVRGWTGLATTAQSTRGDGNTVTTVSAKYPFSSPGEGTSRVSFSFSLYGPAIVSLFLECSVWPPLLLEPTALCWAGSQASTHRAWPGWRTSSCLCHSETIHSFSSFPLSSSARTQGQAGH